MLGSDFGTYVRTVMSYDDDLRSTDRLLLIALGQYADPKNGAAWPSVGRLAADCGFDSSTARRSLNRLCELGLVKKTPQRSGYQTNTYVLARELLP